MQILWRIGLRAPLGVNWALLWRISLRAPLGVESIGHYYGIDYYYPGRLSWIKLAGT